MQISSNKAVTIDYMLDRIQDRVLDSTEQYQSVSYIHGIGAFLPGLEKALEGKAVGDKLEVTVPPEEGYGERNPQLLQRIPKIQFAKIDRLELGMVLHMHDPQGHARQVTVLAIEPKSVVVDANHPLAGATLHFKLTVREIRDATAEELEHRHVHGPGGHHH